jgi:hypothetical protein
MWPFRRKPPPIGGAPTGQLGGKSGRINEWPKCRGCWHRVPPGALHGRCRRATAEGQDRVPASHQDGAPCCPGWCRICGICWDQGHRTCNQCGRCVKECPGPCPECGECKDMCKGHKGDGED